MKDDAVAPIIAVMLILAAIVTFYSLWNAIYVPSMKQSAEIDHLHNVETSFVRFSSDLYFAASSHQDHLSFSEPVPLGGGDTLVNELKSSGALQVQDEDNPVYTLTFADENGDLLPVVNGTMINFSYEPVSNFWQNQGYMWQYGYTNVTKNRGTLSTPLDYYNMTDIFNGVNATGSPLNEFASSLGGAGYTPNLTAGAGNCSAISLIVVNISASSRNSISSNGYGFLTLTSTATPVILQPITGIAISSDGSPFGNISVIALNASLTDVMSSCPYNVGYISQPDPPYSTPYYTLTNQTSTPPNVNLTIMQVTVGAH
ncbi:hypothetical protein Mboo_2383 [Methanoregula boonei 6A8]|jgi:hypothetical protein|uniref:Archaeal Type IV pilin N-terminal domain-containing protein n=1 Tax=Methanoregula boonei (strain DSM 21154 / JCM 14090 / 6A8) TaxID=456442 RepID=A7IAY6_METB6|nr:hypothetical protein [Methanoregula boonei]ABS56897.1 hypothetical protein Mboo_2383 [Methanoregula boonei 6A8]